MENWKAVVNYEGIYEVSDNGRVRRIAPWTDGRNRKSKGLRTTNAHGKYARITLYRDRTRKEFAVHRLVLAAFVGPLPRGYETNHKDGNHFNNSLENLEYMTHSQNQQHSLYVLGKKMPHGHRHWNAKLTEDNVRNIRSLRMDGHKLKALAFVFGVSVPTVCWICKGKEWKHV